MCMMAHDLTLCTQHFEHKCPGMDQRTYFVRMLYSTGNPNSQHILADSHRMDFHSNQEDIDMSQCHFVHDRQHSLRKDLECTGLNFQQDSRL